jgi:hypothetical protein
MSQSYWPIMEKVTVDVTLTFLNSEDFDVREFSNWLCVKFNTALHRTFCSPTDFDLVSLHLAILGFKQSKISNDGLRNILHFLIYHHYMIFMHKIDKGSEISVMRAKIAKISGVNLEEYDKGGGS